MEGGTVRYVWTVEGDDPDFAQGDRHGIDGYFYPFFDSLTTKERLIDTKAAGYAIGVYYGHNWGGTAAENAAKADAEYKKLYVPGLKVMFNWEQHKPDEIASGLEAWRVLRKTVNTSWSMEGMQGGWMSSAFVKRVLATRVRWVPQSFVGNMERRESDATKWDIVRRGVPENIVSCFYDAAQLGANWDGFAFTAGRLPA
jgi:hypothetical protein